ncbi:LuxR C-terminal-related transcriptional regulator [Enterobacter cloacae]|uniref:helix-turn-helix transcriptional regulator n=1 Tax=Enterobacter cloacae TaxID=550 RepID=UPI00345D9D1F
MNNAFIIAIGLSDNYFSLGIKHILRTYFHRRRCEVRFISLDNDEDADLIILSEDKTRLARPCRIKQNSGRLITVLDDCGTRSRDRMVCVTEVGSLSRRDNAESLLSLVSRVFFGRKGYLMSYRRCPCCSHSLIKIEKDVLQGLYRGLSLATMARLHDVSIQSVSRYKRSAMTKLGFERNHELYNWLLQGGLEHEKRILTWL